MAQLQHVICLAELDVVLWKENNIKFMRRSNGVHEVFGGRMVTFTCNKVKITLHFYYNFKFIFISFSIESPLTAAATKNNELLINVYAPINLLKREKQEQQIVAFSRSRNCSSPMPLDGQIFCQYEKSTTDNESQIRNHNISPERCRF